MIVNNFFAKSVFFVRDTERAKQFYLHTFGFSLEWNHQEQNQTFACEVSLFGLQLILNQIDHSTENRAGHGRVFIGLDDNQAEALLNHIKAKNIKTKLVEWGQPTIVIRDLDENEMFFWLPENEREKLASVAA